MHDIVLKGKTDQLQITNHHTSKQALYRINYTRQGRANTTWNTYNISKQIQIEHIQRSYLFIWIAHAIVLVTMVTMG